MKPMKPVNVLSYENCYNAAKQFTRLYDFRKEYANTFYCKASRMGWLKDYTWLVRETRSFSYEDCFNTAKKYDYIKDFKAEHRGMFDKSKKQGWFKDYTWLKRKKAVISRDDCFEIAKQFKYSTDLKNAYPSVYVSAVRHGWIKDYTWFEKKPYNTVIYTHDLCVTKAKEYEYLFDFTKENPAMYDAIVRNGWRNDISFLKKHKPIYSKEEVKKVAMKYDLLFQFRLHDEKYYKMAKKRGWLSEFTWLKRADRKQSGYWYNYDNNKAEALKYKTLKEFGEGCQAAYHVARKEGFLETYTWLERKKETVRSKPYGYWEDFNTNREEALKYKTRTEFAKNSPTAYNKALQNGWLDKYDWFSTGIHAHQYSSYKLSALKEYDVQKGPTDNRFFSLKCVDIFLLIKAHVLTKDFLTIATTPRGTRERLNAMQTLTTEIENRINNGEDYDQDDDDNADANIEVNAIENMEQVQELDADETDLVLDDETGLPIIDNHANIIRNADVPGLDTIEPTSENGRGIVENTLNTWFREVSSKPEFVEEIRNYHGSKFFDYIKELFFVKYNATKTMANPEGYSLSYELHPYQKLLAYELEKRDSYSMWLDMGGGKTNCALYASRHNNLHNTVVIAPKSVLLESWVSQIYEAFPDSKVIAMFGTSVDDFKSEKNTKYNNWIETHLTVVKEFNGFGDGYTYLLVNYDKFSQEYAKELGETIASTHVDYVVLDEVQNVKVRTRKTTSERHVQVSYLISKIREHNPGIKTSALTGTPLLNNLMEVKSIIEITTGEKVTGIKSNRVVVSNVVEANKALTINGFRYCPTIQVKHVVKKLAIDCTPDVERKIRALGRKHSFYSDLESVLTIAKINSQEVIDELKPGTIVYLLFPYKNNTASEVVRKIESLGYKVGTYFGCTVDRHQVYNDFVNGDTDILVASSPVCEGIDGLQNRCDNMVILSLPQTYGKYDQLIKRVVRKRKGSSELKDKEVTIVLPQIFVELNENDESDEDEWSWDESRWNAIRYKKSLSDAVLDGDLQKVFRIDWNKLYRNAMKVFQNGVKDEDVIVKPKMVVEVSDKERKARERANCVVTETHRLANSSNHHTTHQRFIDNPDEFNNYHRNRELAKADWAEDPVDRIAYLLNKRFKGKKIADLGCGTNKLSTLMKNGNTVTGFDHQRYNGNKDVVVADIADLSGVAKDGEFDVAVFCLSLWGKDYQDYFKEARRILKNNRWLYVVEPVSNFGEGKRFGEESEFIRMVTKHGFTRVDDVEERNNFAYFRFLKED